jgi:hypothetical protein
MGGGPDLPSRDGSKKKEVVLCALPWPEEQAASGIKALKEAFEDVEVAYYHSKYENGKSKVDVPEGMCVSWVVMSGCHQPVSSSLANSYIYFSRVSPLHDTLLTFN